MSGRFFNDDDKLGRKQYADFLKTIIDNSDKYKRNSSEQSYVIAVDSSWGTGKTYFLDMFENYLLGRDGKDVQNDNSDYVVIRFDAWKNDFWDNAFEPFVSSIIENDNFFTDLEAKNAKDMVKGFVDSAITIAKGVAKKKLEDYISTDDLEKALEQSSGNVKNFMLHEVEVFPQFLSFKQGIEEFKKTLAGIIRDDRKIVIIIDELDRCKPTFAIQLLEIVKHLFDVNGLTFLFLIDIEQLSYSVQTVYGQGMDSTGYLCRFFDYITRMPRTDVDIYIDNVMEGIQLFDTFESTDMEIFKNFFMDVCDRFLLNLRDIDTVISSYKIMLDAFLRKYSHLEAHSMYLFYLVLKYKDVEEFNNLFLKGGIPSRITQMQFDDFPCIEEALNSFDSLIEDLDYVIISAYEPDGVTSYSGNLMNIKEVKEDKMYLKDMETGENVSCTLEITDDVKLNDFLFAPDIAKWEDIKYIKYGEYIHRQLEMFDFVYESIEDNRGE